jgi:hypothetical protein
MPVPIEVDVDAYEAWLGKRCPLDRRGLDKKHDKMADDGPHQFMRATYFRWAKTAPVLLPDLAIGPRALSVGDIHVENYGSWRDAEARLAWGVNDFDETADMPAMLDLVRLGTSFALSGLEHLGPLSDSLSVLLAGYRQGLAKPAPTLLHESNLKLRKAVTVSNGQRRKFWDKLHAYKDAHPPTAVRVALTYALPEGSTVERFATRRVGSGSLGRPRFLIIGDWRGGHVVREAKALAPSAWTWAHGPKSARSRFMDAAGGAYRAPDPFLRVRGRFVIRRIAPDSRKIELDDPANSDFSLDVLALMGADLGAIHAAQPTTAKAIVDYLETRPDGWLDEAVGVMVGAVHADYQAWRAVHSARRGSA